jgi:hypothetical protein
VAVDLLATGQRLLQVERADHVSQRGHRELLDRLEEVGDLVSGPDRVDDPEVEHGVDRDDEVVGRDHRLGREADHLLPHVDLGAHRVDERHQEVEARRQGPLVLAQPLHDVHPLLRHDPHRTHDRDDRDEHNRRYHDRNGNIHP